MAGFVDNDEYQALSRELLARLDQHSIRIDASQADAWSALDKSFEAISTIYQTGLDAQAYTDKRIQQLRDELRGTWGQWGEELAGGVVDTVSGSIDAILDAERKRLEGVIADFEQVTSDLGMNLDENKSLSDQILDIELPSQREEIQNLALRESGTRGTLDLFLQDFGHPSAAAGLDELRSELEEAIKPMRNSYLRLPASHWTMQPDVPPFSPKPPPEAAWFIENDTLFGDCLALPVGRFAIGPSLHIPFSPKGVYKLTLRYRVTAAPASGGASVKAGMTTWRTTGTPAEQAAEVFLAQGLPVGSVDTLSCYVTADAALALMLEEDASLPVLRLVSSSGATRAFPYFAQPDGGTQLRIDFFDIRDVTDAVGAMQFANVRMGQAFENIVNIQRDVEEALAGFDPENNMATIWTFESGWKGWATSADLTKHPAELTEIETGIIVEDGALSGGKAVQFIGKANLALVKYMPILPDSVIDVTLYGKASASTAIELVLTTYDSLNQKLGEFVIHASNITTTASFQTKAAQKNGSWGANAARAMLSLRILTDGRTVTIDGFRAVDNTAQYHSARAVAASNSATQAKNDAEGARADAVNSLALAVEARDAAGEHAQAALVHADAASTASGAAGTFASAASSTKLSVEVLQNTGAKLPDTFIGGLSAFTEARAGSPEDAPDHSRLTLGVGDVDYGPFGIWSATGNGRNLLTRGVQRTPGRVLRLTLDFKIVSITGGGTVSLTPVLIGLTPAYVDTLRTIATVALPVGRHKLTYVLCGEALDGVTNVISDMNNQARPLSRAGLRLNENKASVIHIGQILFEDITQEGRATDSLAKAMIARDAAVEAKDTADGHAAKASESASLAATAKSGADSAKSGAETARTGAVNARADAIIAKNDTVTALGKANDAAAAASSSERMAASVSGRGVGALSDMAMPFPNSTAVPGWTTWTTAPSKIENVIYPRGNTLAWNIPATTQGGVQLVSSGALWKGPSRSRAYRVDIEFTLLSGSISGAGVLFDFITTASSNRQSMSMADMCPGGVVRNQPTLASGEFRLPSNVGIGSVSDLRCYVMANYGADMGALAAKHIQIHSVQIYPMTATEAAIFEQKTAVADLKGNAAAGYLIQAAAGDQVSLLQLVAADGSGKKASVAKIKANDILLEGSVFASMLTVGDWSNLIAEPDFSEGGINWRYQGPKSAINGVFDISHTTIAKRMYRVTPSGSGTGYSGVISKRAQVTGDTAYFVGAHVFSNGAHLSLFRVNWILNDGSTITENIAANQNFSWENQNTILQSPVGAVFAELALYLRNDAGSGAYIQLANPTMRPAIDRKLIVNGGIVARHLDTDSMSAAGLEIFKGFIRSKKFNRANGIGWEITDDGEMTMPHGIFDTVHMKDGAASMTWAVDAANLRIVLSYPARLSIFTVTSVRGISSGFSTNYSLSRNGSEIDSGTFSVSPYTWTFSNIKTINVGAGTHNFLMEYSRDIANRHRMVILGQYR